MSDSVSLFLGVGDDASPVVQLGKLSNRHGLIAGATGTGKTISLQVLAESFSALGVPVLAADIKGDLSGIGAPAVRNAKISERLERMPALSYEEAGCPILLWDIFGQTGHPLRTTISELGPLLLAHLLDLNDTQTGLIYAAFRIADEQGLLLLDLNDLRSLLAWMGDNARELRDYGNITTPSIAAIQRGLLVLEEQGGDVFFGEPALNLDDLMRQDANGRGVVSLLDATRLSNQSPRLYACFLLWLIAELFEQLPEVGDLDRPQMVIFFDEAHLLFDNAPKALLERIEQVVRLVRSKGVGIYFVTQSPEDVPEAVLGQLGLRIQHALRAFTPKDRRAITATAQNFRANPAFDTATALTELGTGVALVSVLDAKGSPTIVQRTLIRPPASRIGPLTEAERTHSRTSSVVGVRYDQTIDRESAHEVLRKRADALVADSALAEAANVETPARKTGGRESILEAMAKSVARSVGSQLGRQIIRGVLGALLGGKR